MKMIEPLVSVVIPTYNRPKYLKRCLDSVLMQSYKNIEIFVVDDNNPNTEARLETEMLMDEYRENDRVSYVKHEYNKNGSAARNTGWRHAAGKYITYVDDDDVIASTKIQKQVECLEALDESWGACYTGYTLLKPNGAQQKSSEKRSGNCYVYALMRTMFMGSGSNLFLRKSVVDEIQGYDETFVRNQDIEFMVRALEKYKLAYIDENLLIIHQEKDRKKRSFEEIDGYAKYFLFKFEKRINNLSYVDKKNVLTVISLERMRIAFSLKHYKDGIAILRDNKVSLLNCLKYFDYLVYRKITKKSFGFSL